jgi:hypothetical protein
MISQTSRYYTNGVAVLVTPEGDEIRYLRRRFLPDPGKDRILALHMVSAGERPDIIAARYLGDPEVFWRLCDANGTDRPDNLTKTAGKRIKIPFITGS